MQVGMCIFRFSGGIAEIQSNDNEILYLSCQLTSWTWSLYTKLDIRWKILHVTLVSNSSFQTGEKKGKKQLQVMASMHRLLRFALEQDPGRAETPREGLILFIVRLAIRVESYGRLVVEQRHRVGKRQVDAKQQSLEGMLGRVWKNKQQIFFFSSCQTISWILPQLPEPCKCFDMGHWAMSNQRQPI